MMSQKEIDTWARKEPEKLTEKVQKFIVVGEPEDNDTEWLSEF